MIEEDEEDATPGAESREAPPRFVSMGAPSYLGPGAAEDGDEDEGEEEEAPSPPLGSDGEMSRHLAAAWARSPRSLEAAAALEQPRRGTNAADHSVFLACGETPPWAPDDPARPRRVCSRDVACWRCRDGRMGWPARDAIVAKSPLAMAPPEAWGVVVDHGSRSALDRASCGRQ